MQEVFMKNRFWIGAIAALEMGGGLIGIIK
jgi:hypothetical protein